MSPSRREFLATTGSCACYLAAAAPLVPLAARSRWAEGPPSAGARHQTPFARLEPVGDGLTAIISTPLEGDFTTICNGGIIEGSSGTLVVEAFGTPEGARWAAERARDLTGRWPTHVVVTHHHGDHVAGVAGFREGGSAPELYVTEETRDRVLERAEEASARAPWADVIILPGTEPVHIDLGDRDVSVVPRRGHTGSDVTVEIDGGLGPVWCGDLVWNAMFPNFVDAAPSRLSSAVGALGALPTDLYVGGHGPVSNGAAFAAYVGMLQSVEAAAREAWRRGLTAAEAADEYEVPSSLGEWMLFNPLFYQRAMEAWLRELEG
ncbi:MAG: MBL fold metallo-hydrolase [Gemmatimonadota bacterium]|nr:MBL fold metallo-hydrolase [Gemmatimonadota bacterium]